MKKDKTTKNENDKFFKIMKEIAEEYLTKTMDARRKKMKNEMGRKGEKNEGVINDETKES